MQWLHKQNSNNELKPIIIIIIIRARTSSNMFDDFPFVNCWQRVIVLFLSLSLSYSPKRRNEKLFQMLLWCFLNVHTDDNGVLFLLFTQNDVIKISINDHLMYFNVHVMSMWRPFYDNWSQFVWWPQKENSNQETRWQFNKNS